MLKEVPFEYLCFLTQWNAVDGTMTDIVKDYLESQTQFHSLKDYGDRISESQRPVMQDLYKFVHTNDIENACKVIYVHKTLLEGLIQTKSFILSRLFVRAYHSHVVENAREFMRARRVCFLCGKRLVPIGHDRINGRDHEDWERRMLHKKCWLETLDTSCCE